jgi:hypothetical protein
MSALLCCAGVDLALQGLAGPMTLLSKVTAPVGKNFDTKVCRRVLPR